MRLLPTMRARSVPGRPRRSGPRASRWLAASALGASGWLVAATSAADPDAFDPSRVAPQIVYNYGETETPRSEAMGGALRALGNGTTALFLNPADLALTRLYHIEALAQITPETGRQVYGGAVVDSSTAKVAMGASVMVGWADPSRADFTDLDVRAGLAYPIGDHLFIGIGGRYLKAGELGKNAPFGTSDPVDGGLVDSSSTSTPPGRVSSVNTLTFDAGVTLKLGDSVYLSAVGQNLTYPNNLFLPTTLGGGLAYGDSDLSLEVDALADLTSWGAPRARVMGGAEYLFGDHFPVRLGYNYDQGAKLSTLSGGFGYIGQQFSIEGALKRTVSSPGATGLVFSFAYFLDSSSGANAPSVDDPHEGAM